MASSSCSTHQPKNFDVFLSFRGEDTRRGFISHLHDALCRIGIKTFIDYDLPRGEEISVELLKTIENSTMSIIVFSENYASSTWCLEELAKIVECGKNKQSVRPVFYKVDPSEVRKQEGKYGEALTMHEEKFNDKEKIRRWRNALCEAANLSGWDFKLSRDESELVQNIVEDILKSGLNQKVLPVAEDFVGINSRVEDVLKSSNIESNDGISIVGIYGLGGVGKTTIAKAIYDRISYRFEAKIFLENVREKSKTNGIIHLQETILSKISGCKNLKVHNISSGTNMIIKSLCRKRVLIVLDDVDNSDQIGKLLGKCDWFASGSRIIMTAREKRLIETIGNGVSTYQVKELDENESIELLSKHAFQSNKPNEDYLKLVNQVIRYAKGLPLALVVIGADLYGRTKPEWESALKKYEEILSGDIQKILQISYDGLDQTEKHIFLDIACFFKGYSYSEVVDILGACDLHPEFGIKKLIDKCLLNEGEILWMHDLLQQMGREIVRQESEGNPGQRSRLCNYEEALDVLTEDMGSDEIRGIMLRSPESKSTMVQLEAQIFRKMKNLRFLIIHNVHFHGHGGLEYLPNGLRLLEWDTYPFSSLPSSFCPKKLVVLRMPRNGMVEPLMQIRAFEFVTRVDFSCCPFIRKTPDLSMCPNIKDLDLSWCENLVEIENSVGRLDMLVAGDVYGLFFNLRTSPRSSWDVGIRVPYTSCQNMSFGNLIGLRELYIGTNEKPCHLPGSIYNLQHLEKLELYGNFIFPRDVEIDRQPLCNSLGGFSKYVFPSLKYLIFLCLSNQSEMDFILNYCCPVTLERLYISPSCKDVTLPESISRCERLHSVHIGIWEIPRLPRSLRYLVVSNSRTPVLSSKSIFHRFRELIGVPPNLPPCLGVTSHMLMATPSSTTISRASAFPFGKKYVNNEIQSCGFNHQRNGNLISFLIGPEFPAIALCVAFEPDLEVFYYHAIISINGSKRTIKKIMISTSDESGCVGFSSISLLELFEGFNLGDENLVEIFCETSPRYDNCPCPNIEWIGVHVQCICPQPQKSIIFHDNYCIQPRGRRISKRNVHQRLRPSLLKGPNFILRRLYSTQYRSTLWPTPSASLQPLLKARKISNKKRPLVARCRKCLRGAQTHCRCSKEVGSTYSAGPVSVHSSNLESRIISSAMNGGGSSSVSNLGLSMDVKNGSDLGLEFDSNHW